MKPIALFQHTEVGAPGTLPGILRALGCEVRLVRIVDGEPVPADAGAFGGLVFMGGSMAATDDLPWIARELALIRQAHAHGLPVAGHCLGSQLVALALGGQVERHARPEIGWNLIRTDNTTTARQWWGADAGRKLLAFQWHQDRFTPPEGAQQIASAAHCDNQAYVLDDRHLLLQSHLEMTPALVEMSLEHNGAQLQREHAAGNPAVTSMEETRRALPERTADMTRALRSLYARWVERCA
jgi:GMP synthase-like glutamine amidotransferase